MKRIFLIVLWLIPFSLFSQQINVVSFNIRYGTAPDGENSWPNRIEMVNGLLRFHDADIFGLQEALYQQILDIGNGLPGFGWFGIGRDDGDKAGEFTPIFYNKSKFKLLDHGNFWLSETPEKPSKSWDAALNRIVTWGKFESAETGKQFVFFNTHFDHRGVEARKNSAELIWKKIQEITQNKDIPVLVTGDFNLSPDSEPILLLKKHLRDSFEVSEEPAYGPVGTFQAFKIDAELTSKARIDYVFVNNKVDVLKYAALSDFKDHRFPSDHLPVFAKVRLK
jgi:endonuclease/exonuclease/phosphatase family metal-dependent hydrolase